MGIEVLSASVVQFGAGAIGRGFLGQLWTEAYCDVIFVDVNPTLIDRLNEDQSYSLHLVENDTTEIKIIQPVSALSISDTAAIIASLSTCSLAATAVGVSHYLSLAPLLAQGTIYRKYPLNTIVCENDPEAASLLQKAVNALLPPHAPPFAAIAASVGRMVPVLPADIRATNPSLAIAEAYAKLPVDAETWQASAPNLLPRLCRTLDGGVARREDPFSFPGLQPETNFAAHIARKLFTHNGGHAALAYHAHQHGHTTIAEAIRHPDCLNTLNNFWQETGAALIAAYGFSPEDQRAHEDDLRRRFANTALHDTITRVARDPLRKLRNNDRLVGAALLCLKHNIQPTAVVHSIVDALRYNDPTDPSAQEIQKRITEHGIRTAFATITNLPETSPLVNRVVQQFSNPL